MAHYYRINAIEIFKNHEKFAYTGTEENFKCTFSQALFVCIRIFITVYDYVYECLWIAVLIRRRFKRALQIAE